MCGLCKGVDMAAAASPRDLVVRGFFARLATSAAVLAKERKATCQSNQTAYMEADSSVMLGRNIKQFAIRDRQFAIRISLSPNERVSLTGVCFSSALRYRYVRRQRCVRQRLVEHFLKHAVFAHTR